MNKVSRVDANGHTTSYAYDNRHRLTDVTYNGRSADNRHYTYDDAGSIHTVTEPDVSKAGKADVTYTYDELERVRTETSGGVTHTYLTDGVGNRRSVTYGGTGTIIVSTYEALNRLQTMTEGGRVTLYGYDLNGNNVLKTLPNGDVIASTYDALNRRLTQTAHNGAATPAPLYTFAYGYDPASNVVTVGETYPTGGPMTNRVVTNVYDAANRLLSESVASTVPTVTTYAYDAAGNRTSKSVVGGPTPGTTTYSHGQVNELLSYSGAQAATFTYDDNGNRATRIAGGTSETYSYDYENRLVGLTSTTGGLPRPYAYTYDYRTRRVERVETGASTGGGGGPLFTPVTVTQVIFSGGTSVQEIEGGATTVENIRGSDYGGGVGGLLYTLRGSTSVASYTHENLRGDVVAKTNSLGALTYQAAYESFGKQVQQIGSTLDRQKANTKEEDPTGLLNEGYRYRDLEAGCFITCDPAGFVDGPNLYCYVRQNPWTMYDPEGLLAVNPAVISNLEEMMSSVQELPPSYRPVAYAGALIATGVVLVGAALASPDLEMPSKPKNGGYGSNWLCLSGGDPARNSGDSQRGIIFDVHDSEDDQAFGDYMRGRHEDEPAAFKRLKEYINKKRWERDMQGLPQVTIHSVYADGTIVYEGQQPGKITKPDPSATESGAAHTMIKWDLFNKRVYKARTYNAQGYPVKDIDFTLPVQKNSGLPRTDHDVPQEHPYTPVDANNPKAGYKRGEGQPLNNDDGI